MTYYEWESTVPSAITADSLWRMRVYRLALYLGDRAWDDVTVLNDDRRTQALANQLYRAVGSISANLAEGYARKTGRDRARFYSYSLGSARESREWYFKGRFVLGEDVVHHRLKVLEEIIKMLNAIIPRQRGSGTMLREAAADYDASAAPIRSGDRDEDYDEMPVE